MRSRADLVPTVKGVPVRLPRERALALLALALAAGALVWGVLGEQLGETLFNATLV